MLRSAVRAELIQHAFEPAQQVTVMQLMHIRAHQAQRPADRLQFVPGQCVFRSLLDTQFGFSWTAGTVGPGHPDRLSWTRAI